MAVAGAACGDGRGEEEVHNSDADERAGRGRGVRHLPGRATTANNSDDSERWPWPAPAAAAGGHSGEDGRAAPRDVAVTGAGGAGSWPRPAPAAGTGSFVSLYASELCMPAVNEEIEINKGPESKLCMPQK